MSPLYRRDCVNSSRAPARRGDIYQQTSGLDTLNSIYHRCEAQKPVSQNTSADDITCKDPLRTFTCGYSYGALHTILL